MATFHTMSGQSFTLGSSVSSTQTTIILTSFKVPVTGTNITMASMSTSIAFGTIAPGTSQAELISFTGVTQNADGTATLTGVTRGLDKQYPGTEVTGFKQPHAGQSIFILSDAPQVFEQYPAKNNDETIVGRFTFPTSGTASAALVGATYAAPVQDTEIATKKYVDTVAIAGAPDASTTTKGIGKVSVAPASATNPIFVGQNDPKVPPIDTSTMTAGQVAALLGNNTDVAVGSGNKYVTQTGLQHNAEKYAADAGANDTYVITLSPVPTSYTNGMVVYFKANTINTGAATLNVNSLGAKTIVKGVSTTLSDGDILAGQFVTVIYDGTNFVLQNPVATNAVPLYKNGVTSKNASDASTTQNIAHGLGVVPKYVKITSSTVWSSFNAYESGYNAVTSYNGTTQASFSTYAGGSNTRTDAQTFSLGAGTTGGHSDGVVTFDATNIIITWTKVSSPTGTFNLLWEATA